MVVVDNNETRMKEIGVLKIFMKTRDLFLKDHCVFLVLPLK